MLFFSKPGSYHTALVLTIFSFVNVLIKLYLDRGWKIGPRTIYVLLFNFWLPKCLSLWKYIRQLKLHGTYIFFNVYEVRSKRNEKFYIRLLNQGRGMCPVNNIWTIRLLSIMMVLCFAYAYGNTESGLCRRAIVVHNP